MNKLFFGDNLTYLKQLHKEHPNGFIDLCYNDPPFNSKRNYNVLFESIDMTNSKAQREAFTDTWSSVSYIDTLNEISDLDIDLYKFLMALNDMRFSKSSVSYLTIMAIRIYYIHKLLKPTGSFYLHCDPTMSHYLKLICDLVFGEKNFRNEIVWKRKSSVGQSNYQSKQFGYNIDIILFYSKTKNNTFNSIYEDNNQDYIDKFFIHKEAGGRIYRLATLTSPSMRPNLVYDYKGHKPPDKGWAVSFNKMVEWERIGKIYIPEDKNKRIQRKIYLDELKGQLIQALWDDINVISPSAKERLGYPTQKPEALLERIIYASSNEGDLVADFFCGCGTTIAAAEKLNRRWLGIDISHLAVKLIAERIGIEKLNKTFEIHGFPKDIDSARELANNVKGGRLEFEQWIVEVMLSGILNQNRTEMGFDGYRTFIDGLNNKHIVMIEVKSGHVTMAQFNHFIMTVNNRNGSIGIFVCFKDQITKNMQIAAKNEGKFRIENMDICEKIQISTVEDLLDGRYPNIPRSNFETFKQAVNTKDDEKLKKSDLPSLFD